MLYSSKSIMSCDIRQAVTDVNFNCLFFSLVYYCVRLVCSFILFILLYFLLPNVWWNRVVYTCITKASNSAVMDAKMSRLWLLINCRRTKPRYRYYAPSTTTTHWRPQVHRVPASYELREKWGLANFLECEYSCTSHTCGEADELRP